MCVGKIPKISMITKINIKLKIAKKKKTIVSFMDIKYGYSAAVSV
jgi:hypothetical protein